MAKDKDGILRKRMEECLDGDYQTYKSKDGAYVREHFFNTPELKALVADMTDEQIWALNRGGHDPQKVYNAYDRAVNHADGKPILSFWRKPLKVTVWVHPAKVKNVAPPSQKNGQSVSETIS